MKKVKLDKNTLLGGIILENERYQVVHMNLKTGNQTEFELLEIPAGSEHVITCLQDAQVFVVKL